MVIMTGVVNPWVFIAIVPLSVLLVLVRHYYLQTSRQLQRLEGISKSDFRTRFLRLCKSKLWRQNVYYNNFVIFSSYATLLWSEILLNKVSAMYVMLSYNCIVF